MGNFGRAVKFRLLIDWLIFLWVDLHLFDQIVLGQTITAAPFIRKTALCNPSFLKVGGKNADGCISFLSDGLYCVKLFINNNNQCGQAYLLKALGIRRFFLHVDCDALSMFV